MIRKAGGVYIWILLAICQLSAQAGEFKLTVNGRSVIGEHNAATGSSKVKLVIAFHALASSGKDMLDHTGLRQLSQTRKFILAAPEGRGLPTGWAAGQCCIARSDQRTDVDFVAELIAKLKETYSEIDLDQIYLIGFSNGAIFAHRLAYQLDRKVTVKGQQLDLKIRGIATLAGTISIPQSDLVPHKEPIPWIHFHGTADQVIQPTSTAVRGGYQVEKLADSLDIICKRNNASVKQPVQTIDSKSDNTKVNIIRWDPATGATGAPVAFYEVEGGGHTWPGHQPPPRFAELVGNAIGTTTEEIKAEEEIQKFFDL